MYIRLALVTIILLLSLGTRGRAQFDPDRARADVGFLTSRQALGRGYYGEGHLKAASYIRDRFRSIGLDSVGGGYFQPFEVEAPMVEPTPRLAVNGSELRFGLDYIPETSGGSGQAENLERIVRVGNGLVIPPRGIDPYDGRDIRGGVVIIEDSIPKELTGDSSIPRDFLSADAKYFFARRRGAKAIIFLVDRLTYGEVGTRRDIPVFQVRRGALPAELRTISFSVQTVVRSVQTNNVVAYLPGTGRSDSTIILCAHYDHLGAINDSLYFPGANDNASGTAMLLAMARTLKRQPLRFGVIFIAFSGEEMGLRGSRYYVEHPLRNLEGCRFLLNLDMTASGDEGLMAVGGTDYPQEFALLQNVVDSLHLGELRKRANASNSDQYFFTARGIHGFYIYPYTGYQPYHHIDDRPETLEWNVFEKMYRVTEAFLRRL
jgi:hypothetical protein